MSKAMRDFTKGELEWRPWLTPIDLAAATAEQRDALKITPSMRAVGAYSLEIKPGNPEHLPLNTSDCLSASAQSASRPPSPE